MADEYEKLVIRMNTPRVVIDNAACADATIIKVDSVRKRGILLEAIQVLTDLNLSIRKGYISSDGGRWFMDVFHVTDLGGHKLADESVISFLEQSLNSEVSISKSDSISCLELLGTDRPGLLSEIFAVLSSLSCSVVDAKIWTHRGRIAAVIYLKDVESGSAIRDLERIDSINARLRNVLNRGARTTIVSPNVVANADRRLHRLMYEDRDYERRSTVDEPSMSSSSSVSVQNWTEKGYSVVSVESRDRANLLFDVVCALTDLEYVVFHGTIDTDADRAHLEFYIRHLDGRPISSDAERLRVIQCLQAAIERRASEGLRLELCTTDQQGLLADMTRTFRENGLSILRAEISTKGSMAINTFYVTNAGGEPVDYRTMNEVIKRIGADRVKAIEDRTQIIKQRPMQETVIGFNYLGSLVKRNLYNLGLIGSCS